MVARRWETSRVEAFSDGVFAIAITLLVLEIKIEPEQFEDLWRALADEWPSYLAYVTSFLTVGERVDRAPQPLHAPALVDPVAAAPEPPAAAGRRVPAVPDRVMAQAFDASESAERAAVASTARPRS